jgi:hypothetical protein
VQIRNVKIFYRRGTMRPMPTSPPKRGGWIGWTAVAPVLLPVLYVLASGSPGGGR